MNRLGFSKDIHILEAGKALIIGGINIPSNKGAVSYSDGDCLTHAIIDALLGAINYKDIGEVFSNADPKNKNRSSIEMLRETKELIKKQGFKIINIDTFISLEQPKLSIYKSKIAENIAKILNISSDCVSIKAGTNEGIGDVGMGNAIECYAICLVEKE